MMWSSLTARQLLALAGALVVASAGATFAVVKLIMDTRVRVCEEARDDARIRATESESRRAAAAESFEKLNAELEACKGAEAACRQKLDECQEALRCAQGPTCEIPRVSLTHGTTLAGAPNPIDVALTCTSGASKARLLTAVRVQDARGGRSWWAADVIPHRDGVHPANVYLGVVPPGGKLVPVVLRELVAGTIRPSRLLTRAGQDFEELCSMPTE